MHGLRAGAPRREFEQFVTDSADQLLRTVYLTGQGRSHAEHIQARINASTRRRPRRVLDATPPPAQAGAPRAPPRLRR
jgi:hypothetical protein